MADIHFWRDSITNEITEIESLLNSARSTSDALSKSSYLANAEKKLKSSKATLRSFKMETRLLANPSDRSTYETEHSRYERTIAQFTSDLNSLKSDENRNQLFLGANTNSNGMASNSTSSDPTTQAQNDGDAMLSEAQRLQDKTSQSLANTQTMIEESKTTGMMTLEELARQKEQLVTVDNNVNQLNDDLNRADQLIKTFGKRMATDKMIQCFAVVNVILVVSVVVYSVVKSQNDDKEETVLGQGDPLRGLRGF